MNALITFMDNPKQRRQFLTIASAILIVLALLFDRIPALAHLHDVLMIAAALLAGSDIALRAGRSLLNRHFSIELLVTIAASGALIIGEYWEAAAVTFLFIFGAYLEARALGYTRRVLQDLLELDPGSALVLRDGQQIEVLPHEIGMGETVLVKPGAKIPVDGEVTDGRSSVDESPITGESMPEEKVAGHTVYAGTVNQSGLLKVRAVGVGADTTLARIIRRVEEAQDEKAPTQRFIEGFARWYTPAIIVLSFVAYLMTSSVELALTLLVIACPGALVISTPVSVVAGIGATARSGVLIKGGEYLENAGKISAVTLDKTGTLTAGKPRLTDIRTLDSVPHPVGAAADGRTSGSTPGWTSAQQNVLWWAAIAESGSEHPLARPIMEASRQFESIPEADSFETFTGKGIQSAYAGHTVTVGTAQLMRDHGITVSGDAFTSLDELSGTGKTAVLVAVDDVVVGVLGIMDTIRADAPEMVRQLYASGVKRIAMLTGDDPQTAQAIAVQVGITEVHAGLLPDDKLRIIRDLQREGHTVAMVGDGINDAPALAAADIGIAMGAAGTDVAIETADMALMADDLLKLPTAITFSKATLRNIRQNVLIALVTVIGLIIGVLTSHVHMGSGMLIHELSVLLVIVNALRLLRQPKESSTPHTPAAPVRTLQRTTGAA